MANSLLKYILFSLLFMSSFRILGAEVTMGEKVLSIAVREIRISTASLGKTITACENRKKKLDFRSLTLPDVNKRDMLIAFLYLSGKITNKCEEGAWERFYYSLVNYDNVIQYYGIKQKQKFKYAGLAKTSWKKYKIEVEYFELGKDVRAIFEQNKELRAPFDARYLFKELEKSGRFKQK